MKSKFLNHKFISFKFQSTFKCFRFFFVWCGGNSFTTYRTGLGPRVHPFSTLVPPNCLGQMVTARVLRQRHVSSLHLFRIEPKSGPNVRCFHETRSVALFVMSSITDRNQTSLSVWFLPTLISKVGTVKRPFHGRALCTRDAPSAISETSHPASEYRSSYC